MHTMKKNGALEEKVRKGRNDEDFFDLFRRQGIRISLDNYWEVSLLTKHSGQLETEPTCKHGMCLQPRERKMGGKI